MASLRYLKLFPLLDYTDLHIDLYVVSYFLTIKYFRISCPPVYMLIKYPGPKTGYFQILFLDLWLKSILLPSNYTGKYLYSYQLLSITDRITKMAIINVKRTLSSHL